MTEIGNRGYEAEADALAVRYESRAFDAVHPHLLALLPPPPAAILDVGAGTGRDAGALAARGYHVTAAEPTAAMRAHGQRLHASPQIDWIDDHLPQLVHIVPPDGGFAVILLTAVWMHLDAEQRAAAMPRLGALAASGALLAMTLRHGPVPAGRRMFDVSAAETIALAAAAGFDCIGVSEGDDGAALQPGISWDRLVFRHR
jgi:SAM-dependent methyltransferase